MKAFWSERVRNTTSIQDIQLDSLLNNESQLETDCLFLTGGAILFKASRARGEIDLPNVAQNRVYSNSFEVVILHLLLFSSRFFPAPCTHALSPDPLT